MISPLVTVDELERILGEHSLRIIDCRWDLEEPGQGTAGSADVISLCDSGVAACLAILAMEMADMRRTHLYVGSSTDLRIAIGATL